jgi:hypothetical protein
MNDHKDQSFNDLSAENAKLRALPQLDASSKTTIFVWAAVALSMAAVLAVTAISIARPDKDNTGTITMIVGIIVPSVTALIAKAVQEVHLAVNSRLTQLIQLTATASRAEGQLEAKHTNGA